MTMGSVSVAFLAAVHDEVVAVLHRSNDPVELSEFRDFVLIEPGALGAGDGKMRGAAPAPALGAPWEPGKVHARSAERSAWSQFLVLGSVLKSLRPLLRVCLACLSAGFGGLPPATSMARGDAVRYLSRRKCHEWRRQCGNEPVTHSRHIDVLGGLGEWTFTFRVESFEAASAEFDRRVAEYPTLQLRVRHGSVVYRLAVPQPDGTVNVFNEPRSFTVAY
jgi:hypothetical protein